LFSSLPKVVDLIVSKFFCRVEKWCCYAAFALLGSVWGRSW